MVNTRLLGAVVLLGLAFCAVGHAQGLGLLPSTILSCPTSLSSQCADGLRLANSMLFGAASNVDPSQLANACNTCRGAWQSAFNSAINASASTWGAGCGGPADAQSQQAAVTLTRATTDFVCYPAAAPGSTTSTASACPQRISNGLQAANVLNDVTNMNPNLRFTGAVLQATCNALVPQGCCLRTWAALMAAYAQQLCLPALAHEYLALPGRCAVLNPTAVVYDVCIGNWTQNLLGVLQPLSSASCRSWATPEGGSSVWSGAGCSPQQLQGDTCPQSTCDLYCGMAGAYRSSSAAPASGSSDAGLSTWVIIFVSVVSGVIGLILLLALLMFLLERRKERLRSMRASGRSYGGSESAVAGSSMKSRARDSFPRTGSGATAGSASLPHTSSDPRPSPRLMRDIPVGALGVLLRGMNSSSNRPSISSLGGASGPTSMAVSSIVGRSSMVGNSMVGNTITSITHEEGDEIAPLPGRGGSGREKEAKGVVESLQPLRRSAGDGADASPVHYTNALYGNPLPPTPSPPATPSPPDTSTVAAMPATLVLPAAAASLGGRGPSSSADDGMPRAMVHRSSRSFSFGVDGVSRLPPANAVAEANAANAASAAALVRPTLPGLNTGPAVTTSDSGWTAAVVGPARSPPSARLSERGTTSLKRMGSSGSGVAMTALPSGRWRTPSNGGHAGAAGGVGVEPGSAGSSYHSATERGGSATGSFYSTTSAMPQRSGSGNLTPNSSTTGLAFTSLHKSRGPDQ